MLFAPATFADVNCYNYGVVTNCTNGVTAYQYGSTITSIHAPGQQPVTVYRYGNLTNISSPNTAIINPIIPSANSNISTESFVLEPLH